MTFGIPFNGYSLRPLHGLHNPTRDHCTSIHTHLSIEGIGGSVIFCHEVDFSIGKHIYVFIKKKQ